MGSRHVTNGLLVIIAITLAAHLMLSFGDRHATAETFQLDNCITSRPGDKPTAYLHVVPHTMSDVDSH